MNQRYRKAVFIATYRKDKNKPVYLILKRKLHWKGYEFPKGGIENKESFRRTVARELFEETGLKPKKINDHKTSGKFVYDKSTQKERGFYGQTYKLFSAEVKKSKIKLDSREHSGYKWLGFKEAEKKLTFRNQKKCLRIVDSYISNA